MNDMGIILIVAGCAAANYMIRVLPFLMTSWDKVPLVIRRFLSIMPIAALGALIFPGAFTSLAHTGKPWAALGGLAAAAVTAHFSKNLILPVAAAVAATWLCLQVF